jgi:hypothetical protein
VIYRETIGKYLSAVFLYLGYIMAGIDREKRAFHDMLADTRVVYALGQRPAAAYPQPMAPYQYPQRPQGGEAQSEQPQNKELQNGAPFQTMGPESQETVYPAADYGVRWQDKEENNQENGIQEDTSKSDEWR